MNVVITGASGLLGRNLAPLFPKAVTPTHAQLDISGQKDVSRFFATHPCDLLIHCAAATHHRTGPTLLLKTNVVGTALLAQQASSQSFRMVYLSTDYVYQGKPGLHKECDPVLPHNPYAWSKLGGECAVRMVPNHLIIRTSFHAERTFMNWSSAATDAFTSKVPVLTAAQWVASLATSETTGILNVGGARMSLFEMAVKQSPNLQPVARERWNIPPDSSLDTTRFRMLTA